MSASRKTAPARQLTLSNQGQITPEEAHAEARAVTAAACKSKKRPALCQVAVRQADDHKMLMESTDGVFAFFSEMPTWPGSAPVCAPPVDLLAADFSDMTPEMFRQQAANEGALAPRYLLDRYPDMTWAHDHHQWEEPILLIDSPLVLAAADGWGGHGNRSKPRRVFAVFGDGAEGEITTRYVTTALGGGEGHVMRPADLGHGEPARLSGRANGLREEIGMDLPRLAASIRFAAPGGEPVVLQQMRRRSSCFPRSEAPHRLSAVPGEATGPARRWAVLAARPPRNFGRYL